MITLRNLKGSTLFCAVLLAACRADAPAREQHPRWTLAREAVAGAGEDEGALTQVGGVAVGTDGTIYVVQARDHLLRVYDRAGRFVRAIGREGEGPGEFDSPARLGWRGDTLWVQDGGNRRISFFRPDGTFIRSLSFARAAPLTENRIHIPGYVLADGSVLGYWQASLQMIAGPRRVSVPLVRFTEGGEPLSRLGAYERYHQFTEITSDHGVNYGPQPFTDSPLVDVAPDGSSVVVVNREAAGSGGRGTFTLRAVDPTGRVTLDQRMGYAPIPLRGRAVDSVVAEAADRLGRSAGAVPPEAARERELRGAMYIPRHFPPVTSLILGRDGTIWLQREWTGAATAWWHVLDPSGRVIANVPVPATLSVQYADSTQLWAVERDEDDVPTLVRFRVSRGR